MEDVLPVNTGFDDFKICYDLPGVGRKTLLVDAAFGEMISRFSVSPAPVKDRNK